MLPGARKPRSSAKFAVESFDQNTHAALENRDDRSGIYGPFHSADPVARASSAGSMDSKLPEGDFRNLGLPRPRRSLPARRRGLLGVEPLRVRGVTPNHEDWVGEAKGRKAEKSDTDEEDFPETKGANAN